MVKRAAASVLPSLVLAGLGLALTAIPLERAYGAAAPAPNLIVAPPDDRHLVRLPGNTRPEATARNDRGPVPDTLRMEDMQMLLRRPPQRQRAFERYLEAVQDPRSTSFHHWLTPVELAQRFGPSQHDIDVITRWLTHEGFRVDAVRPGTLLIVFSGTAGEVRKAFHTQIHYLDVGGQRHIANMSDPEIPAALAPAVAGIVSLHNLGPHPLHTPISQLR